MPRLDCFVGSKSTDRLHLRMRKLEADVSNIDTASTERLAVVEQRLTDLEIRMMRQESRP